MPAELFCTETRRCIGMLMLFHNCAASQRAVLVVLSIPFIALIKSLA